MKKPIAFTFCEGDGSVRRISLSKAAASTLLPIQHVSGPAVVMVRQFFALPDNMAGIFDVSDVVFSVSGDWDDTILIVSTSPAADKEYPEENIMAGDLGFVATASTKPHLSELAERTILAIRDAGIEGNLVEKGGRWVNQPINSFTLKVQPRSENLAFTLYGNPSSFEAAEGFLRQDQNSYSRGWVRSSGDVEKFVRLVKRSHARRIDRS